MAAKLKKRKLTQPLFSLGHKPHMIIKVTGEIYSRYMPKLSKNEDGSVTVVPCIDIDTGEEGLLLGNAVVISTLQGNPNGYVGHIFELVAGDVDKDKGYRNVDVFELDDEEEEG